MRWSMLLQRAPGSCTSSKPLSSARVRFLAPLQGVEGVSDVRDESDRTGTRVVVEVGPSLCPCCLPGSLCCFHGPLPPPALHLPAPSPRPPPTGASIMSPTPCLLGLGLTAFLSSLPSDAKSTQLKNGTNPDVVLAKLYKDTKLEGRFPLNCVALSGGVPRQMGLKQMLEEWLDFRRVFVISVFAWQVHSATEKQTLEV